MNVLSRLRQSFEQANSQTIGEQVVSWIRLLVVFSMAGLVALGEKPLRTYPGPVFVVLSAALAYSCLAFIEVARQSRRGRIGRSFAWSMTAADAAVVVTVAALTGAAQSPILPIMLLDVIVVAMRFNFKRALAVACSASAALAVLMLSVPRPRLSRGIRVQNAIWWTLVLVLGAMLAGMLSYLTESAHRRRARAEADMFAEHSRLEEEQNLRRQLEIMDEARKDFLHALSHDFKTPMGSLEALARALTAPESNLDADQRTKALRLIEGHARHLGSMLQEVREVVISDSLGPGKRLALVDVFVPDLIKSAAAEADIPMDRLCISIDPAVSFIRTDQEKVFRVLTNLIDNAHRHSPADQNVEVHVGLGEGLVELTVLDRGPGIPPELASRVFEKFFGYGERQASGLGMWIVAQFVAALDGSVLAEPRPGGGLIVRVRMPHRVGQEFGRHNGALP
jgi:signal transduction histidine kinase